ncbi:MAG: hypothetical protein KF902_13205 [Phycisphaeraceae bacterium]|nr:hypothetical protein [Phycisphaeraceae bacterium]
MPPSKPPSVTTEIDSTPPYRDYVLNGSDKDVMSWIRGRIDGNARSVEVFYKMVDEKHALVGRVWLRTV